MLSHLAVNSLRDSSILAGYRAAKFEGVSDFVGIDLQLC